jgi:hypothetical protein
MGVGLIMEWYDDYDKSLKLVLNPMLGYYGVIMVILLDSTILGVFIPHTLVLIGVPGSSGIPLPFMMSYAPPRYDDMSSVLVLL